LTSFLDRPAGQFLDQVAARVPAPGGGGAAAMTAALAAGLVAMAARFSAAQLPDAGELASRADRLRHRAAELVTEDGEAYQRVLDAFALPRDAGTRDAGTRDAGTRDAGTRDAGTRDVATGDRDQRIRMALEHAAAVPEEMTQIAAQVAGMAARLAGEGNPNLRGDSVSAAILAEASARSAACLVDINVALGGLGKEVSLTAAQNAATARAAAQQAQAG
jgi:methenyltetrahydrofolate cyclohydrolase